MLCDVTCWSGSRFTHAAKMWRIRRGWLSDFRCQGVTAPRPSLRAKRSNPASFAAAGKLDCFRLRSPSFGGLPTRRSLRSKRRRVVAVAPRNDGGEAHIRILAARVFTLGLPIHRPSLWERAQGKPSAGGTRSLACRIKQVHKQSHYRSAAITHLPLPRFRERCGHAVGYSGKPRLRHGDLRFSAARTIQLPHFASCRFLF